MEQTQTFRKRYGVGAGDVVPGLAQYLQELGQMRFFGVVEVQYQDGEIVLVRKSESLKPAFFLTK